MRITWRDYEAADREQQERNYFHAEEERERAEALEWEADPDPVYAAVDGWLNSQRVAVGRRAA